MHFQVIKDDFFKKLFTFLKTTVPEFVTVFDEEDGIYPILGEFGRFMINNIFDKELMVKCFDFLNQSLEKGSQEVSPRPTTSCNEQWPHIFLLPTIYKFMEQITNKLPRIRRTQEQIKKLLEEFENGDKTVSEFCELYSIGKTAFYKWQSRYKRKAAKNFKPVGFAKLKIHTPNPNPAAGLFAEVHGIKIYQPVGASYLKELCVL